jgi:hypothetical protein
MPDAWSAKRERQYEHIKESEKKEGRSTRRAKEIAARTVNKQRAQSGEAKTSSRGGSSSRGRGRTKEQLYNEAKRLGIEGRSRMNKEQLQRAVSRTK